MKRAARVLRPTRDTQTLSLVLAMIVRNAMEDFHVKHVEDAQMKELNTIVRNAILTGLHAFEFRDISEVARSFVDGQVAQIPKYWETPELLPAFVKSAERAMEGKSYSDHEREGCYGPT